MTDDYTPPETRAESIDIMDEMRGRDIVTAEAAQEWADPFGVDLSESDIVHPTSELLPYREDDDTPAVAVHDLVRHLVAELGGDPHEGSPLIGRGSGADFEYDQNFPKLEALVAEEDTDD